MKNRQFILMTLKPLLSDKNSRQVTGLLTGLPTKNNGEFISLWNAKGDHKNYIAGAQGNIISKIHWLIGNGEDEEEGIVFFSPVRDSDNLVDVDESRKVMRKAIILTGALFKKLLAAANTQTNKETMLVDHPEKLHRGYPDYDFERSVKSETQGEMHKRIEQTPLEEKEENKSSVLLDKDRTPAPPPAVVPTTAPTSNVSAIHHRTVVYPEPKVPMLISRRPNQHVKKRIEKVRELLKLHESEKVEEQITTVTKSAGGNGSSKYARRSGGAAGSLCATCVRCYTCDEDALEYHSCDYYVEEGPRHMSQWPDGM